LSWKRANDRTPITSQEGADFVYAKNWAAYADPDYGKVLSRDRSWTVDAE